MTKIASVEVESLEALVGREVDYEVSGGDILRHGRVTCVDGGFIHVSDRDGPMLPQDFQTFRLVS